MYNPNEHILVIRQANSYKSRVNIIKQNVRVKIIYKLTVNVVECEDNFCTGR